MCIIRRTHTVKDFYLGFEKLKEMVQLVVVESVMVPPLKLLAFLFFVWVSPLWEGCTVFLKLVAWHTFVKGIFSTSQNLCFFTVHLLVWHYYVGFAKVVKNKFSSLLNSGHACWKNWNDWKNWKNKHFLKFNWKTCKKVLFQSFKAGKTGKLFSS